MGAESAQRKSWGQGHVLSIVAPIYAKGKGSISFLQSGKPIMLMHVQTNLLLVVGVVCRIPVANVIPAAHRPDPCTPSTHSTTPILRKVVMVHDRI